MDFYQFFGEVFFFTRKGQGFLGDFDGNLLRYMYVYIYIYMHMYDDWKDKSKYPSETS